MRSSNHRLTSFENKVIAVIGGGVSSEREVSLRSAKNVATALRAMGLTIIECDPSTPDFFDASFDIAFNCLHGEWGEDGGLQGYCHLKGIPYTGPGIKPTMIGYDKPLFKQLAQGLGILTPSSHDGPDTYPFIVKPKRNGSSIGVHIVKSESHWHQLMQSSPEIAGDDYFFESYIDGIEITSGVLTVDNTVVVLPILEIETSHDFYDLDAKYTPGKTDFILPARVPVEVSHRVIELSTQIYKAFGCKGCIRIDIIVKDHQPYVLEMNTNPGLTELSDIPAQAAAMGMDFKALMGHYLASAI
ncbi:MAG: D-alanine--D-alanine ligase family protein [Candidatus Marinamargulisbacteria bacterium]